MKMHSPPKDILLTLSMLVRRVTLNDRGWVLALRIKWYYWDPIEIEAH